MFLLYEKHFIPFYTILSIFLEEICILLCTICSYKDILAITKDCKIPTTKVFPLHNTMYAPLNLTTKSFDNSNGDFY